MEGDEQRQVAPRVLIVEDHALNLKLLNDILEYHGYATIVTGSGRAAVDLARQYHPALILLDIQLPDIPGTEAARRLKVDEQTRSIPIVAVTAFAMPGDRTKILESGCDDYVAKPFNVRDFLALVEHYTSKRG
jgi:two-component system, cell cycle response regulator DivK